MTTYRANSASHSVEQAVVGIRLLEDADEHAFLEAVETAAQLQELFDLPGRVEADPMALMFGRQSVSQGYRSAPSDMKPGMIFQRVNRSGAMESELTVERSAVTFRTRDYTRWSDMQKFISGLLAPVTTSLCKGETRQIAVVELRCIDKFVASVSSPKLSELINENSRLVAQLLKSKAELLHSHIGWFENESAYGRTLVNVNIDLSENQSKRVASILQVVSKQSNGAKATYLSRKSIQGALVQILDELHLRDKAILGNILNDSLIQAIGLAGKTGIPPL